jgi:hypothetical protein
MKPKPFPAHIIFLLMLPFLGQLSAQIPERVYLFESETNGKTRQHELKIKANYLTYSIYESAPPHFIKTLGGFYEIKNDSLKVQLEFNSDASNDKASSWSVPYSLQGDQLTLKTDIDLVFSQTPPLPQDLDGLWLFAARGPDKGQDRRGGSSPRKTLKFLMDGHFQWIAYNTDTMEFFGTGGGLYSAKDGIYTENIKYFSRDDARVGASLEFEYRIDGHDWHHTGKNSKGEPLYEIWAER